MVKKEFLTVPIDQIIPYPNNPRFNDEAVPDIVASMDQCGDLDPIEVDENMVILSGHTRLKAMLQRGQETADILRYTGLTEGQKKKYRILANKTGEKAKWDFSKLEEELENLDFGGYDFGLAEFSFDEVGGFGDFSKTGTDAEYFSSEFTFPVEHKDKIISYLRKHKGEIQNQIVKDAVHD